jgi:hypothetical protein
MQTVYEPEEPAATSSALARRQDVAPVAFEPIPTPRETERTDLVWAALAKAQQRFEPVRKERKAEAGTKGTYTYANLDDMMRATRPALQQEGLTLSWRMAGARMFVRLIHTSGQWIESDMELVPVDARKGVQALGAALTYCRRYLLSMLLGVVPEDVDTDAEAVKLHPDLIRFVLDCAAGAPNTEATPHRPLARGDLIETMRSNREPAAVQEAALRLFDERAPKRAA